MTGFERHLRTLANVPRWGIVRLIRQQSVAEHSYFVSCYTDKISYIIGWPENQDEYVAMIRYALYHDVAEAFTSDIPHPVKASGIGGKRLKDVEREILTKRFSGGILQAQNEPSPKAKLIVRVADLLESTLYLCSEQRIGNQDCVGAYSVIREQLGILLNGEVKDEWGAAKSSKLIEAIDTGIRDELEGYSGWVENLDAIKLNRARKEE